MLASVRSVRFYAKFLLLVTLLACPSLTFGRPLVVGNVAESPAADLEEEVVDGDLQSRISCTLPTNQLRHFLTHSHDLCARSLDSWIRSS